MVETGGLVGSFEEEEAAKVEEFDGMFDGMFDGLGILAEPRNPEDLIEFE